MSRLKAFICSALLMIVIFTLLFATIQVNGAHDISLFYVTTSTITGLWVSDKVVAFYKWLRKDVE